MDTIDVQKEVLAKVELSGHKALFTELRVEKSTVPEGVYCYALRHGDDDSFPAEVEETVCVNYFGSVLMTEKLELGETGKKSLSYEDFVFTGEELRLEEFLVKSREEEPDFFQTVDEFVAFLEPVFPITEQEGGKLLGYMEGHEFPLGHKDGELYRRDLCYEQGKVHWEPYDIEDAINDVAEWNYDFIQEAETAVSNATDMIDFYVKSLN